MTVEIEHVDVPALEAAAQHLAMDVEPTPATLSLIQVTPKTLIMLFCRASRLSCCEPLTNVEMQA